MAARSHDALRRRPSLIAALAVSGAGLLAFVGWTLVIQPHAQPPAFDWNTALAMREFAEAHSHLRGALVALTFFGSVPALTCLAAVGVFGSLALKQRHLALVWLLAAAGGGLLDLGLKTGLDRQRPPAELRDAAIYEQNESYPSGHAMGSIIGFGMVACAGFRMLRRPGPRL